MLSPSYQRANPYKSWATGFANTRKIEVKTSQESSESNIVWISLTATDAAPTGKEITRQFIGTWKVIWDEAVKVWQLSDPTIKEVTNTSQVRLVFQPILETLKGRTQVAILLPTVTYTGSDNYVKINTANATGYQIEISEYPNCKEASCRVGNVSAETITPNSPPNKGQKVTLVNGTTGYFVELACEVNCSDSTLTWNQGNVRYTITLRNVKMGDMVTAVNSAISGGKV
jgi:hypothetical protein